MESQTILNRIHYKISFRRLAQITVILPLGSLVVCFITAMLFQYKEVNTTFCDVYNVIPSISAITGISPQRYVWRIGVAFHCTPRLLITSVYHSYYLTLVNNVEFKERSRFLKWLNINYWLNVAENLSLVGVTYISNRENYPVHEKLFIIFMTSSLSYMLLNTILYSWGNPTMTFLGKKSYYTKVALLAIIMISATGLIYFFYRHRRFCEELAFSCFSFCEYCMAVANMAYHATVVWDCPDEYVIVGAPVTKVSASSMNSDIASSLTSLPSLSSTKSSFSLPSGIIEERETTASSAAEDMCDSESKSGETSTDERQNNLGTTSHVKAD